MAELLSGTIDGARPTDVRPTFHKPTRDGQSYDLGEPPRRRTARRLDLRPRQLPRRCYVLAEQLDEHRAEIDPADSDYARARASCNGSPTWIRSGG